MNWSKESGPKCPCGMPTFVDVDDEGNANLICIFHTYDSGAIWPLPKSRPDNWPNLSDNEIDALIELGFKERESNEDKQRMVELDQE
jgi:hypothetical protein